MTDERDHWFKFKGPKWRDGTRGLEPADKGIYADVISLMHETADAGYPDDARKIARDLGYRDYRTVAAPLTNLKAAGKFVVWRGRLYNPTVCRDRHKLAVKRKARCPVPAEVWALIEALEQAAPPPGDPEPPPLSPAPVDGAVGKAVDDAQPMPETGRCSSDDRPMIEDSGRQVVGFPRKTSPDQESDTDQVEVVESRFRARARGDPRSARA